MRSKLVGTRGEKLAEEYLLNLGYRLVYRNWSCGVGELDLVMFDRDTLVFVEVKSRSDAAQAREYLLRSITEKKKRKLCLLSKIFIQKYYKKREPRHRIDVLGVLLSSQTSGAALIRHIRAAL